MLSPTEPGVQAPPKGSHTFSCRSKCQSGGGRDLRSLCLMLSARNPSSCSPESLETEGYFSDSLRFFCLVEFLRKSKTNTINSEETDGTGETRLELLNLSFDSSSTLSFFLNPVVNLVRCEVGRGMGCRFISFVECLAPLRTRSDHSSEVK